MIEIFAKDERTTQAVISWQKHCRKKYGSRFPKFKKWYDIDGIENRSYFPGRMLEQLLGLLSNGNLIEKDANGMDFHDMSDAKFRTVTRKGNRKAIQVGELHTKKGALRICAIDPDTLEEYFLFIPRSAYKSNLCIPVSNGKVAGKYAPFQVEDLETLANRSDCNFAVTT